MSEEVLEAARRAKCYLVVDSRRRVKEWEERYRRDFELLETSRLHVGYCNNHLGQVGDPGCSCPVGRIIKSVRSRADEAERRLGEMLCS
jgi:hypothetical protein